MHFYFINPEVTFRTHNLIRINDKYIKMRKIKFNLYLLIIFNI